MDSIVSVGRVCVVSPHLDDAVLSCGNLLAQCEDSSVLTVFSAHPPAYIGVTAYDASCGFSSSTHAMRCRLQEDDSALAILGAAAHRLDALDSQYGPLPEPDVLAGHIGAWLMSQAPDTVLVPMGLFHCDHECVAAACDLLVTQHGRDVRWIAYEDALYRRRAGVLQRRLIGLFAHGIMATPVTLTGELSDVAGQAQCSAKARAVACYASQLKCLGLSAGGDHETPERYWLLDA